jgi:hypothetical protein
MSGVNSVVGTASTLRRDPAGWGRSYRGVRVDFLPPDDVVLDTDALDRPSVYCGFPASMIIYSHFVTQIFRSEIGTLKTHNSPLSAPVMRICATS